MIRYFYLADFASPADGPVFDLIPPFDKLEVVQGSTPYPPNSEKQVIVMVECQRHTALAKMLVDGEAAFLAAGVKEAVELVPIRNGLSILEGQMRDAALKLAESYEYLGVEEYA